MEKFVVAFGDAEYFVGGLDPIAENGPLAEQSAEDLTQGSMQALSSAEERFGALRVILGKSEELRAAFRGNDSRHPKESKEILPGEIR